MDLLPIHDFWISGMSHLENIGLQGWADFPNVDAFIHIMTNFM